MKVLNPAAALSLAFAPLALAPLAAASLAAPAYAQVQQQEPGRLSLSAEGKVTAAPDMAMVSAGVVAEGKTAAEAMAGQRASMNGVIDALKKAGVAEADIRTSGLTLNPVYNYNDGGQQPGIIGYQVSNQVSAVARDLSKVGPMLDALVDSGANTINGVEFGLSNSESLLDEARKKAMTKLKAKASLYEEAGGFKIVRILDVSESQNWYAPQPVAFAREAMAADMSPTPVQGGQLDLTITVNAMWAIE